MDTFPLIPGIQPANPGPLARFLPPLEDGVVTAWLAEHVRPGAWLLDPFGTAPRLSLEAARAGYRVLVTANNPITRFLLEMGASAPSAADFNAALADLAVSRKGEERLESHLQALYITPCANCGRDVPARSFLWRKGESAPYARLYECKECGESGEKPITPADAGRVEEIQRTAGLARARALERVAPLDDPDREYAEEAIQNYLPRAIYALATLINRLDGLAVSPERRRALTALVLSACDFGNTLWPHPVERPRPKQLSVPSQFMEHNLWLALENAIPRWAQGQEPVPCVAWPEKLPSSGGILLYEGRVRDLAEAVKESPIQAVISAMPRPNQAFWTLSALWAGWLWGRETAETFKVALRRRRYDWGWHASALHAALRHVFDLLQPGTSCFGLLAEADPGYLTAALTAASTAGFDLQSLAMRTAHDPLQIVWKRAGSSTRNRIEASLKALREDFHAHLRELGEPAAYLQLYAAGLAGQALRGELMRPEHDFDEALRVVQSNTQQAIQSDILLERQDDPERSLEVGLWGLREGEAQAEPLADRVEMAVVKFLQKHPGCTLLNLERGLYREFPNLLTPSKALLGAVLDSYVAQDGAGWSLRPEDQPALRRAELNKMTGLVRTIGKRLGYATRRIENEALAWFADEEPARVFYVLASAMTGRVLAENRYPVEQSLIVIPGGRAGLLAYKQNRDRRLKARLQGWRIVKFRLLRSLAEIPVLSRQSFDEQIASDPVEQSQGQMMMF